MKYTVLVADDNDDLREEVAWLLRGEGYRVVTATDGIHALDRLRAVRTDALVLDWNMPRLGGSGVLAALSRDARFADLPVIVATAEPERVTTERPMLILAKPFSVDRLLDVLRSALEPRGRAIGPGGERSRRLTAAR